MVDRTLKSNYYYYHYYYYYYTHTHTHTHTHIRVRPVLTDWDKDVPKMLRITQINTTNAIVSRFGPVSSLRPAWISVCTSALDRLISWQLGLFFCTRQASQLLA